MEENEHSLKTVQQIAEIVTAENIDSLTSDFKKWLGYAIVFKALPKGLGIDMKIDCFNWIEDGKGREIIRIERLPDQESKAK